MFSISPCFQSLKTRSITAEANSPLPAMPETLLFGLGVLLLPSIMDEFDGLEPIVGTYGDVFEGFDDFDRAIEAVEDFIRLVKDPKVNGYVKRAEAEKVLGDLDEFRRRYLDIVGKRAEMLCKDLRSLILRVWRGRR